jgi:hypothetical protein
LSDLECAIRTTSCTHRFESKEFEGLLGNIDEAGGHWTQAFGGAFLVSLPQESELNFLVEIEKLQS